MKAKREGEREMSGLAAVVVCSSSSSSVTSMWMLSSLKAASKASCAGMKSFLFTASRAVRGLEEFLPKEVPDAEKPVPVYGAYAHHHRFMVVVIDSDGNE